MFNFFKWYSYVIHETSNENTETYQLKGYLDQHQILIHVTTYKGNNYVEASGEINN